VSFNLHSSWRVLDPPKREQPSSSLSVSQLQKKARNAYMYKLIPCLFLTKFRIYYYNSARILQFLLLHGALFPFEPSSDHPADAAVPRILESFQQNHFSGFFSFLFFFFFFFFPIRTRKERTTANVLQKIIFLYTPSGSRLVLRG